MNDTEKMKLLEEFVEEIKRLKTKSLQSLTMDIYTDTEVEIADAARLFVSRIIA